MKKIKIFNTLSNKKEYFIPNKDNEVSMYVCGPTTYNFIHLGNARPLVVFDVVRRYLEYYGYKVKYVQNFTDIDDKIIKRAREENSDSRSLAQKYIREYFNDVEKLNVREADAHPKVTENIDVIIEMIKKLIDKDYAYVENGDVYFDVWAFEDYGKLSGRSIDDMKAGSRVEVEESKRHPLDFALWKASKEDEPGWDSPWGKGRPGWHIECSAMSVKYLGMGFDIHGGGYDLVFPHHENEIAQAEAAMSEEPFVKYWLHNGFITVNEEKMSKSLGNFFLVRDILNEFPGDVVRFYLLSTHYRSPLDFDDKKLLETGKGLERIKGTVEAVKEAINEFSTNKEQEEDIELDQNGKELIERVKKARAEFEDAMNDDFNTSLAIAVLFDFCRFVNSYLSNDYKGKLQDFYILKRVEKVFSDFGDKVLGILYTQKSEDIEYDSQHEMVEGLAGLLLEIREKSRKRKDFETADYIRDKLKELGIEVKDTPQGPRWSYSTYMDRK